MEELFDRKKIESYLDTAKNYLISAKDVIPFDKKSCANYLILSLSFIKESLDIVEPYLSLGTFHPFARSLDNLAKNLESSGFEVQANITRNISKEFTTNVLRKII